MKRNWRKVWIGLMVGSLSFGSLVPMAAASESRMKTLPNGRVQVVMEFQDAKEAEWATGYIAKMKSKNILQGFEDGTFRPNQPVTRVQAIVTAVRLMGLEEEAKAKSPKTSIHFKDADVLDKQFPWAKGYVIVALENGLFDASENQIQPDKPASRVWVSSLLVRALGLQSEALRLMTKSVDFKDVDEIPAGAMGYINAAVDHGIVSGYPDLTFKPNTHVTRAEMAALLNRTNEGLMENSGAVKVTGIIKSIEFGARSVTRAVYDTGTVTDSVYKSADGQITVTNSAKETFTYQISSDLLVEYHHHFIRADHLAAGDQVKLVTKNNIVIEAALREQEEARENKKENADTPAAEASVRELELKAELQGKGKIKVEYKNKDGERKAEVEIEAGKDKQKLKGDEAAAFVEALIGQMDLFKSANKTDIVNQALASLQIERNMVKEFKLKVKTSHGSELEIEVENK